MFKSLGLQMNIKAAAAAVFFLSSTVTVFKQTCKTLSSLLTSPAVKATGHYLNDDVPNTDKMAQWLWKAAFFTQLLQN